jgi:hypothetical protein
MSLTKHKRGTGNVITFKRVQQRAPRRPLEATHGDFARWDAAAERVGLNWSEFTRRALNAVSDAGGVPTTEALAQVRSALSEKPTSKRRVHSPAKTATRRAGRKG